MTNDLRGRPRLYTTDAERVAAHKEAVKRSKAKTKMVSVDADLQEKLNAAADSLAPGLGFRPTLSQTIRFLLNRMPQP